MQTQKNTRQQLQDLFITLQDLKDFGNVKFQYAVNKNLTKMKEEITTIMFIETGIDFLLVHYREDYKEIIKKHGELNPETQKYEVPILGDNYELAQEDIKVLNKKYSGIIENYVKQSENFHKMMNAETAFPFLLHKISSLDLPVEMTEEQMSTMIPFNLIENLT